MNHRDTQIEWTKEQLLVFGTVSRNAALKICFTRLSGRIKDLNDEGWKIKGEWVKTDHGKDYIYRLISFPSTNESPVIFEQKQVAMF